MSVNNEVSGVDGQDPAGNPIDADLRRADGTLRLDAYYYGFDSTGVVEIDRILAAVAVAGKGYHHTGDWNEDRGDGRLTYVEQMQVLANRAAETIKQLRASGNAGEVPALRQRYVMAMEILQSDLYRNGDDELRAAVDATIAEVNGLIPQRQSAGRGDDSEQVEAVIQMAREYRDAAIGYELMPSTSTMTVYNSTWDTLTAGIRSLSRRHRNDSEGA